MFDATSRYALLNTTSRTGSDGRARTHVTRRFLPRGEDLPVLAELRIDEADRLDLIAHRMLGNSELFWRICDATDAMDPFELTDVPGAAIRVPYPSAT